MSERTPPPRASLSNTVIIGGLLVIAAAVAVQEFTSHPGLEPGSAAPAVDFRRLDGTPLTLPSLRGKVVLLNFWATWCPPCNDEMPELVSIAHEYEGRGVVFLASNQEGDDERSATLPPWLMRHPEVQPYVVTGDHLAEEAFLVEALPTTYVIDAHGNVVRAARGQVSGWQVKQWLDDALAK